MQSELALQRLNEVRQYVDGDIEEMVDAVAMVVALQQDMSSPMLGAKVTVWLEPPTTTYKMPVSDAPDDTDRWQYKFITVDPERWEKWDFPWYDGEPDEQPEEVVRYDERVNEDDPYPMPHKALVFEGNVAGDAPDGPLWDPNEGEYRTADDYPLGTVNAIVGSDHNGDGVGDLIDLEEDYPSDVQVFTSITPADGDPSPHQYTPGWPES